MSRRNQARRRRTYGRRQHEVRERRIPGAPEEGETWTRDGSWGDWTTAEFADDQRATDDGTYGSYLK